MRKVALVITRIAVFNACVIMVVLLIAAPVTAFSQTGNFPTQRDRLLVASMLVLFALVAAAMGFWARKRVIRLVELSRS